MDRVQVLSELYPLEDLLLQNDIEPYVVVKYLVDEGLIELEDYFYTDTEVDND